MAAVVELTEGADLGQEQIEAHAREHLAGYKVPKDIVFVGHVQRSPAGKADYRWAKATAAGGG